MKEILTKSAFRFLGVNQVGELGVILEFATGARLIQKQLVFHYKPLFFLSDPLQIVF